MARFRHGERTEEREKKKLTISTPRNDFQHRAHIGIQGESFGNISSLNSADAPEIVKKALTLNHQPDHYATLTKKSKSKILQISKTIIRPDRPQIFKRRQDSDSEDDDDVGTVAKDDYSDLLDDVLAVMDRKSEMSTVIEEDSDDSSVLSEPDSVKVKGKLLDDDSYMAFTSYHDLTPKRTSTIMLNNTTMTDSSTGGDSPDKKRYSNSNSSQDIDEDREKRLAAVIDRFRSDVNNDKTIDSDSTQHTTDEEGEFVIEEESFCDEPIVTLRNDRSRASKNLEKRSSTIDQIKRNELKILGVAKKGSIHSTDREVML